MARQTRQSFGDSWKMILKFDHISFTCKVNEIEKSLQCYKEYGMIFWEKHLMNPGIKKSYMAYEQNFHDIVLLNSNKGYPVEITAYDKVEEADIDHACVDSNKILFYTQDKKQSTRFYEALGFRPSGDDILEIKPVLDKKPLKIEIAERAYKGCCTLDTRGYGILAFVVDRAGKMQKKMCQEGYTVSDITEMKINGRDLKVFFVSNGTGDIVEMISLK